MQIVFVEGLGDVMSERGITEEDVKKTIECAERDKTFIEDGDSIIGKHRMENMTVYAAYEKDGDTFRVGSVYGHRVRLTSEQE